jgi:predicted nicotinamide N-methyase
LAKTEEELGELGLAPPFWAFAWAGGQGLARYVLDHPEVVYQKRVLDFACGSGLVAIAAKMAGAGSCHGVDIDPFAIAAARLNAELELVWSQRLPKGDITRSSVPDVDVVFCGDVFYDRHMADEVLIFLDKLMAAGIEVYVGDPGRSYLPNERLKELCRIPSACCWSVGGQRNKEDACLQGGGKSILKSGPGTEILAKPFACVTFSTN